MISRRDYAQLEQRNARLKKLVRHNEGRFVRYVDPGKPVKFNQSDFENVDYITLYVDGEDIDSIETTGRGAIEVLKTLMIELQSYVNLNIKGLKNSEFDVWLEFYDVDDNMLYRSDLPTVYTDSFGRVMLEKLPRRGVSSVDKLCLDMFDKHCLV